MNIILLDEENKLQDVLSNAKLKIDIAYSNAEISAKKAKIKRNIACVGIIFMLIGIFSLQIWVKSKLLISISLVAVVFLVAPAIYLLCDYIGSLEWDAENDGDYKEQKKAYSTVQTRLENYNLLKSSSKILQVEIVPVELNPNRIRITYENTNGDAISFLEHNFSIIKNTRTNDILIDYGSMEIRFPYQNTKELTT